MKAVDVGAGEGTREMEALAAPFYAPPYGGAWYCKGFRRISAVCELEEGFVKELLVNTPFRATGSRVEIFTDDLTGHSLGPFYESGVAVPVAFRERQGVFHPVMFVTSDVALIAGREVFGYPKLQARIEFVRSEDGTVIAETIRNGETIMHMSFKSEEPLRSAEDLCSLSDENRLEGWEWSHHLLVKSVPAIHEGKADILDVLYRDIGGVVEKVVRGGVALSIGESREVSLLHDVEVAEAYYLEGNFARGWSETREVLERQGNGLERNRPQDARVGKGVG